MRRIVVGIGVVVLSFVLVGSIAVGVGAAESNDNGTNASFGAEISSFMQASDTETAGEVDEGMFDAAMNRSTDPEQRQALIENRTERLEERNRELRAQRDRIDAEQNVRSHAIATRVAVGSTGLERAADRTERAAQATGADPGQIDEIRSSARELRGPDVVTLTPSVAGPPGENVRGPPGAGSPGNHSMGPPPGASDSTANRSGAADGNGSQGPPGEGSGSERSGPSDESEDRGGSGPPDEANDEDRSDESDRGESGPPDRSEGDDSSSDDEPEGQGQGSSDESNDDESDSQDQGNSDEAGGEGSEGQGQGNSDDSGDGESEDQDRGNSDEAGDNGPPEDSGADSDD